MRTRVLIVEDEPDYVDALEVALGREGFDVAAAFDGRTGLEAFRSERPDLLLLDLMLPGLSGLDVLRRVREHSDVPVIVVSAKDAEADVVTALELGADDYLTKPYSTRELTARIRAALRRASAPTTDDAVISVGVAELDPSRYVLQLGDERFDLPKKEFEVLRCLMEQAERIVTRESLLEEVWGYSWGDTKSLDQHIRRLRRKLEQVEAAPVIRTVRGVGYRLDA